MSSEAASLTSSRSLEDPTALGLETTTGSPVDSTSHSLTPDLNATNSFGGDVSDDEHQPEDVYNYLPSTLPAAGTLALPDGHDEGVDDIENLFQDEDGPVSRIVKPVVIKSKPAVPFTRKSISKAVTTGVAVASGSSASSAGQCCNGTSCNESSPLSDQNSSPEAEVSKSDCCGGSASSNRCCGDAGQLSLNDASQCCGGQSHANAAASSAGAAARSVVSTVNPSVQFDREGNSNIPGIGKVWIKTWGCSHNNSDGEYMAGMLAASGYEIITSDSDAPNADIWILNSCTVKGPSEAAFLSLLQKGRDTGRGVVVAGCVPQAQPNHPAFIAASTGGAVSHDSKRREKQQMKAKRLESQEANYNEDGSTQENKTEARAGPDASAAHPQGHCESSDPAVASTAAPPPFAGVVSMLGVQQMDRVVEVVEETLKGHAVSLMDTVKVAGAPLSLPKIRKNPLIEIIPINTGCLNQCTYCKTKHARGDLRSYPIEDIVRRVRSVLEEGVVEIWLTSEDLGTYGRDIGTSLPKLLEAVVAELPDGTMLRCGMTNPPYIMEHLSDIAQWLNHPRVYNFLHIPVQSGSNDVLRDMRRQYTNENFRHVCNVLRREAPGITIATDVICGFPTETEEDWRHTVDLCRDYKFPILHINQFYPRPGTPAARYKLLPTHIVKARSRELTALFDSYTTRDHLLNTTQRVLVTDVSTDRRYYVGHNKQYDQVLIPPQEDIMGKMIEVRITATAKHYVMGEIIQESVARAPQRPSCKGLGELAGKFGETEREQLAQHQARFNSKPLKAKVTLFSKDKKDKGANMSTTRTNKEITTRPETKEDESPSSSSSNGLQAPLAIEPPAEKRNLRIQTSPAVCSNISIGKRPDEGGFDTTRQLAVILIFTLCCAYALYYRHFR